MGEFSGKLPYGKTQCTLQEAGERMQCFKNFNASNLHGVAISGFYIVLSYNTIIGLAVDKTKRLYINGFNYGNSTAKHKYIVKRAFWNYQLLEIDKDGFNKVFEENIQ